jgi:hypothetical protein
MDRRVAFFLVASAISAAMWPVSDPEFRWVIAVTALTYLALAVLAALDWLSRSRRQRGRS